jgi:hypothetical protein
MLVRLAHLRFVWSLFVALLPQAFNRVDPEKSQARLEKADTALVPLRWWQDVRRDIRYIGQRYNASSFEQACVRMWQKMTNETCSLH